MKISRKEYEDHQWHLWFSWYPVLTITRQLIWLKIIYRKKWTGTSVRGIRHSKWLYTEKL